MADIRAIRELETWTAGNLVGGLILAAILAIGIFYAVRRFLKS